MSIKRFASGLFAATLSIFGATAKAQAGTEDALWQKNYDARQRYFEQTAGPFPGDILKMLNMTGVWPGGGLFVLPATKIRAGFSVYTTFGLSNPDMPTGVQMQESRLDPAGNRPGGFEGKLVKKVPVSGRPGAAGYGYEFIVVAPSGKQWPLNLLQWAVNAEIGNDVGFLARVEKYDGLTVEQISVGDGETVNVLIAKSQAPLPTGTKLPAGQMDVLVATVVTDQEMRWSKTNGRGALLRKLQEAGVGQVSVIGRASVVD